MLAIWLIQLGIVLITSKAAQGSQQINLTDGEKSPFSLEEFLNHTFDIPELSEKWITDTTFLYRDAEGGYSIFDIITKTSTKHTNASVLKDRPNEDAVLLPDKTHLLLSTKVGKRQQICSIYDTTNGKFYDINNRIPIESVKFDLNSGRMAYVYNNNIYYVTNVNNVSNPVQITNEEGTENNGDIHLDLGFGPNGTYVIAIKYDNTSVKQFSFSIYGDPSDPFNQYPSLYTYKYSKPGTPITETTIYSYNFENGAIIQLNATSSIKNKKENEEYILTDIRFISNTEASLSWTNRVQNESFIIICSVNGTCVESSSYYQKNGWIVPLLYTPIPYNDEGTQRLEVLPQRHGNDSFKHLVLMDVSTNTRKRLTYGHREVLRVYGWDKVNNLVYYAGTANNTPTGQHVYAVNTETIEDRCLTCDFLVDGTYCKYAEASFSTHFTYYLKSCIGPNPTYTVIQNLRNESDTFLWNDHSEIRKLLSKKLMPVSLNLEVPVANNFVARVRMLLPPGLDPNRKYPAIVKVYGGPGSNEILDKFSIKEQYYFVTNRSYIYISIDGRGSGRDGLHKMFQVYRRLGTVEIEDQITVTKYLQEKYPYIDRDNTGIWGSCYGGFASTWALIQDTGNVFKFAVAVAPVTNFMNYHSIYAERYMGLPTEEDNLIGYNNSDVTRRVEDLRGKNYFIIHGTADTIVHYQHAMLLVKALQAADIQFSMQFYTDEDHNFGGVQKHLIHAMDNYFARTFGV